MLLPNSNHDLRRRPRNGPRPSERNLAIHQAYRSGLRSQVALAEKFGVTQCRVSRPMLIGGSRPLRPIGGAIPTGGSASPRGRGRGNRDWGTGELGTGM